MMINDDPINGLQRLSSLLFVPSSSLRVHIHPLKPVALTWIEEAPSLCLTIVSNTAIRSSPAILRTGRKQRQPPSTCPD
jgi:hypothetical protein